MTCSALWPESSGSSGISGRAGGSVGTVGDPAEVILLGASSSSGWLSRHKDVEAGRRHQQTGWPGYFRYHVVGIGLAKGVARHLS